MLVILSATHSFIVSMDLFVPYSILKSKLDYPWQMNKKLQQLKAPKKKQLQATKLSVEGRGMLKYL